MQGFHTNIEKAALNNTDYRRVLYTGKHSQLVLMSLKPNEEIGLEVHPDNDQFFRFEKGSGKVVVNDSNYTVGDGDVVIIPAGAKHNIINASSTDFLKLYTMYSPAHHKDKIVFANKKDADASTEEFDGVTTE